MFKILLALVPAVMLISPAFAQSYSYIDMFDATRRIIIDVDSSSMIFPHRRFDMEVCSTKDEFFCIKLEGATVFFSVPRKKAIEVNSSWVQGNKVFTVVDNRKGELFGRKMNVYIIESIRSGDNTPVTRFVYSTKYGLLAFANVDLHVSDGPDNEISLLRLTGVHILEGYVGVGAQSTRKAR